MKLYGFHVLNPDDVRNGVGKPNLKQAGPYSFRFNQDKRNIITEGFEHLVFDIYSGYEYDQEATNNFGKEIKI